MHTKKTRIDVNWETYASVFPDRYLDYSPFDAHVEAEIERRSQGRTLDVLDIGGGKEGTTYLNRTSLRCWLLDPFINGCPDWMVENLDWNTALQMRFDLIVARGCFNYLTPSQIKAIPSLLSPDGCVLFNTFYKPRTGERVYKNSRTGVVGIERFRYCQEHNIIEHDLEPDDQESIIHHTFFVYRLDDIIEMLGTTGLSFQFLGRNSLCVALRRTMSSS